MTRQVLALTLAGAVLCAVWVRPANGADAPPAAEAAALEPVPSADKIAAAEKTVRDIFQAEYAKTDAASRAALAKRLLEEGLKVQGDLAGCYVLLREARDLASGAKDLDTVLAAAEAARQRFDLDAWEWKVTGFLNVARSPGSVEQAEKWGAAGLALLDELAKADQFEAARKLNPTVQGLGLYARNPYLNDQVQARVAALRAQEYEWQRAKTALEWLKTRPGDADASLTAGRYYAQCKNDWTRALPLLAQGANATLKNAAAKDLAQPADTDGKLAAGDGWWSAAQEATGDLKAPLQRRAGHWYGQVLDSVTGLKRQVLEKRMQTASVVAGAPKLTPLTYKEGLIRAVKSGHPAWLSRVQLVPGSRQALVLFVDGKRALYDLEAGERVRFLDLKLAVHREAISPDGRRLMVVGSPARDAATPPGPESVMLVFCDLGTGSLTPPKKLDYARVFGCGFSADGQPVLFVNANGQFRIVGALDGKDLTGPLKCSASINSFVWQSDKQMLYTTIGTDITVYNLRTGKAERVMSMLGQPGFASAGGFDTMQFSPDGRLAALTNGGNFCGVMDVASGKWTRFFPGGGANGRICPAFMPDSRQISRLLSSYTFHVYDIYSGKETYTLDNAVQWSDVSSDGRFLVTVPDFMRNQVIEVHGLPKKLWGGQ